MDSRSSSVLAVFLQYVEDSGLRTYDDLVIQNASDISRESDRVRLQSQVHFQDQSQVYIQEKVQKRPQVHRLGFMTMPFSQDRPPSLGFNVRSQSLHSVQDEPTNQRHWDQDEPISQSLRKHPPPKPRRDPGTKLSCSSESETITEGLVQEKQPPPKPRRNPSTQLSSSLNQSQSGNHGNGKSPDQSDAATNEEPVYIEMAPNQDLDSDQGEGVYEEMIFPQDSSSVPSSTIPRAVPSPFPNLLSHRPPLLVFPQNQTEYLDQTSPQTSDESPLTPLETAIDFLHQNLRPKTTKNLGLTPEPRDRKTSDRHQNQQHTFKLDRKPDRTQSVDQIKPDRRKEPNMDLKERCRDRRLDSEPDLRPDFQQDQYHSLRKNHKPDWSQTLDSVKPERTKGRSRDFKNYKDFLDFKDHGDQRIRDPDLRLDQRWERSLESLSLCPERVLDQDVDLDDVDSFTVTSSGRASAPPLTSRSSPIPVAHGYRRSQSACPSPVRRPPPYDVIMMSAVMSQSGHMTHRGRAPERRPNLLQKQNPHSLNHQLYLKNNKGAEQSSSPVRSTSTSGLPLALRPLQNQDQPVPNQVSWLYGDLSVYEAPSYVDGPRLSGGDIQMMDTMEKKRLLCEEIRTRLQILRKLPPPPYRATAGPVLWDTEI